MEWDTVFGTVGTGIQSAITDIVPLALPIFIAVVGISLAVKIFGKFGARK